MNFTFSDDQLLFRDTVRDLLSNEVTAERIRQLEKNAMNKLKGSIQA